MTSEKEKKNAFRFDPAHIAQYFDEYGEKEWERLVSDPVSEINLHVHTHYLKEYVPAGAKVLEIGAGAGRFTQILAGLGAEVTVADISPGQLALNKKHAEELGFAHAIKDWQVADIRKLEQFEPGSFDRVVAYGGPFSYVLDERDAAMRACKRVLRSGGILLLSVMSLWGTVHHVLPGVLDLPMEVNEKVVASGDLIPETYDNEGHYMHMFRAEELRGWLTASSMQILALSASNSLSSTWGEQLAEVRQDETLWANLLKWEVQASAEPGALDMGTHMIAVAKKRAQGLIR
jgi:2-polyprenyl-3-methyl-5-hydroxy-6-metoxy-1,4-benzoquinol methylase